MQMRYQHFGAQRIHKRDQACCYFCHDDEGRTVEHRKQPLDARAGRCGKKIESYPAFVQLPEGFSVCSTALVRLIGWHRLLRFGATQAVTIPASCRHAVSSWHRMHKQPMLRLMLCTCRMARCPTMHTVLYNLLEHTCSTIVHVWGGSVPS